MTIKNVHPDFLLGLTEQLPPDSVIQSATSESPKTSVLFIKTNNTLVEKRLTKTDVSTLLAKVTKTIEAKEGESLVSIYTRFCEKYHLSLLNDVDYEEPTGVVEFNGRTTLSFLLAMLPDSIGMFGETEINVIDQDRVSKNSGTLELGTNQLRMKLALVSKVHELKESRVFNVDQLTSAFANYVFTYLTDLGFEELVLTDFSTAKVTGVLNDGISDICFIKTTVGRVFPIRFKTTEKDKPKLD